MIKNGLQVFYLYIMYVLQFNLITRLILIIFKLLTSWIVFLSFHTLSFIFLVSRLWCTYNCDHLYEMCYIQQVELIDWFDFILALCGLIL